MALRTTMSTKATSSILSTWMRVLHYPSLRKRPATTLSSLEMVHLRIYSQVTSRAPYGYDRCLKVILTQTHKVVVRTTTFLTWRFHKAVTMRTMIVSIICYQFSNRIQLLGITILTCGWSRPVNHFKINSQLALWKEMAVIVTRITLVT